jgi:hypothetical protein
MPHSDHAAAVPRGNASIAQAIEEQVARGERKLSPLGRRLLEARRRIEQSGVPLLDDRELEGEKADRRGGVDHR